MNNFGVTKVCTLCKRAKPLSGFYVIKKTGKPMPACKECVKANRRAYGKTKRAKINRAKRRAIPENRQKKRSRDAVKCAWSRGEIPHPTECACVICGAPATHYHHHKGYERENWLDVVPMCWGHRDMDAGGPKRLPPKRQMELPLREGQGVLL